MFHKEGNIIRNCTSPIFFSGAGMLSVSATIVPFKIKITIIIKLS